MNYFFKNSRVDELMSNFGFSVVPTMLSEDVRHYKKCVNYNISEDLVLKKALFDSYGRIKDIRNQKDIEKYIVWAKTDEIDDSDLPF